VRGLIGHGIAWLLMIMLCYQAFTTPVVWGFLAFLKDNPIGPAVLEGWREQPYLMGSLLVGVISGLGMMVVRSNAALRASRRELATTLYSIGDGVIATDIDGQARRTNPVAEKLTGLLEQTRQDAETKAMLLREVNHRVMNNLTMILSLITLEMEIEQPCTVEDQADLQAVLQGLHSRISGIVTVHRMLIDLGGEQKSGAPQDSLDLAEVVTEVIRAALSVSPVQQWVDVVVDAAENLPRLSAKRATTLALIVNELTTNSAKYAFADRAQGRIQVQIETISVDEQDTQSPRCAFPPQRRDRQRQDDQQRMSPERRCPGRIRLFNRVSLVQAIQQRQYVGVLRNIGHVVAKVGESNDARLIHNQHSGHTAELEQFNFLPV